MGTINKVTQGSLAKNNKLNEVIGAINSIAKMSVRQGGEGESPRFVFAENKSELIITGDSSIDEGGGGGSSVEFNGSVLICINGSPYYIDIPYDSDTGVYASSAGANFPISAP